MVRTRGVSGVGLWVVVVVVMASLVVPAVRAGDLPVGACCEVGGCSDGVLEENCWGRWFEGEMCADVDCGPPNDDCVNAQVAPSLPYTFTGSNVGATTDCDYLAEGQDGEVWISFTLEERRGVTIDYCGSSPYFNTLWVILYDECPCGGDDTVAHGTVSWEECGDVNPWMDLGVLSPGTYYYPVLTTAGATGDYVITVNTYDPPVQPNDNCADASILFLGETAFSTIGATTDGVPHPDSDCVYGDDANVHADIWYRYESDCTGTLNVWTCNSANFDTRVAIYEGCACTPDDGDLLVCNDDGDGCADYTSIAEAETVAGACYLIRVGGYGGATGRGTLNVWCDADYEECVDGTGGCFGVEDNDGPGCNDEACCNTVCGRDDYCCEVHWDMGCDAIAWTHCEPPEHVGACCDGVSCVGEMYEADCTGDWFAGQNCVQIDCSVVALDDCETAGTIEDGDTDFDTTGMETDGPAHPDSGCDQYSDDNVNQDIWFDYTASCTGQLTVSTCDQAEYDTRIAIYDGCGCPASEDNLLVCNDDGDDCSGYTSIAMASVEMDECYKIRVGGYQDEVGSGTLTVTCDGALGACCDGATCVGDTRDDDCDGAWYFNQTCDDFECPVGACCDGDTCLATLPESECAYNFFGGETCDEFECPLCAFCDPCYTNTDDEYITRVQFGAIDNESGQDGPCSYLRATQWSTDVEGLTAYPMSVSIESGDYSECVKVFVDWNQDCVFDLSESRYLGCGVSSTVSGNVVVPINAQLGCTTMRVVLEYNREPMDACNETDPIVYGEVEDYTVCVTGVPTTTLMSSLPATDESFWRSAGNTIVLTFDDTIAVPAEGELVIQELRDDGAFGPDLTSHFAITAEGNTLTLVETLSTLRHTRWYGVRSTEDWLGITPFEVHLVKLIGDANNDGLVLPNDLSLINTVVPSFGVDATSRFDINGDTNVLPNDLSIANANIPTFAVPKPSGH